MWLIIIRLRFLTFLFIGPVVMGPVFIGLVVEDPVVAGPVLLCPDHCRSVHVKFVYCPYNYCGLREIDVLISKAISWRGYDTGKSDFTCLSGAYHEQMGPLPSSNGTLGIALSNAHTWSPRWRTFQTVDATESASK